MKNAVYRHTLKKQEKDAFKGLDRYCDEKDAPQHLKKKLENLTFKLGDAVRLTDKGMMSGEDLTEIHSVCVIDVGDTYPAYMVSLEIGGEFV